MASLKEFHDYHKDKTVVIVGPSACLLRDEYGSFIDSHNIVVRVNLGVPDPALKKHVGSRTDVWSSTYGNKKSKDYMNRYNATYIFCPYHSPLGHASIRNAKNFVQAPKKAYEQCKKDSHTTLPTGGLLTYNYYARYIPCKGIDVIGFDFYKSSYFYSVDVPPLTQDYFKDGHNPGKEEIYFREMVAEVAHLNFIEP